MKKSLRFDRKDPKPFKFSSPQILGHGTSPNSTAPRAPGRRPLWPSRGPWHSSAAAPPPAKGRRHLAVVPFLGPPRHLRGSSPKGGTYDRLLRLAFFHPQHKGSRPRERSAFPSGRPGNGEKPRRMPVVHAK